MWGGVQDSDPQIEDDAMEKNFSEVPSTLAEFSFEEPAGAGRGMYLIERHTEWPSGSPP